MLIDDIQIVSLPFEVKYRKSHYFLLNSKREETKPRIHVNHVIGVQ